MDRKMKQINQDSGDVEPATEVEAEPAEAEQFADAAEDMPEDDTPDYEPEARSLRGDLRDAMLMRIRTQKKPWQQMTESEQHDCANAMDLAAGDFIRKTVREINKMEWPHAVVELGEVKIGGTKGIEAKISCGNFAHNREVLGEHVGQQIMIVMVDSDTFMAERGPAQIDKDQPEMDLQPEPAEDPAPAEDASQDDVAAP